MHHEPLNYALIVKLKGVFFFFIFYLCSHRFTWQCRGHSATLFNAVFLFCFPLCFFYAFFVCLFITCCRFLLPYYLSTTSNRIKISISLNGFYGNWLDCSLLDDWDRRDDKSYCEIILFPICTRGRLSSEKRTREKSF